MTEEAIDIYARCILCGTKGLRRLHKHAVVCPCCGTVLTEHGDFENEARSLWEEEQAFWIPLVKRRRGSRTSGRKRHKPLLKRFYRVFDI